MSGKKDQVLKSQSGRIQNNHPKFKIKHTPLLKISYAAAVLFLYFIFQNPQSFLSKPDYLEGNIASVLERSNNVKVKHPKGSTWATLKKGGKLYPNSLVFTGPDSYVTMQLTDNSIIIQGPNSLLRLKIIKKQKLDNDPEDKVKDAKDLAKALDKNLVDEGKFAKNDQIDLQLDSGDINIITSGKTKINSIMTRDATISIDKNSEVNIQNQGGFNTQLAIKSGSGVISTASPVVKTVKLNKNDLVSTKNLKKSNQSSPEELIEKSTSMKKVSSNFSNNSYTIKRKGVLETFIEMGRFLLFLDD